MLATVHTKRKESSFYIASVDKQEKRQISAAEVSDAGQQAIAKRQVFKTRSGRDEIKWVNKTDRRLGKYNTMVILQDIKLCRTHS